MVIIRILLISMIAFCASAISEELQLSLEQSQQRIQLTVLNSSETSYQIDENSFRLSSNGRLYLEIRSKGVEYKLAVLKNDRQKPFNLPLYWGDFIGRIFYLKSVKRDYALNDGAIYTMTAFLCSRVNADYDDLVLQRDPSSCLISNSVEFQLE